MTHRSRNADDLMRLAAQYDELFTYRVFIRKGALRQRFVDDDLQWRLRPVVPIEIAPAQQRRAERAEIARRGETNIRHRIVRALLESRQPVTGTAVALAAQRQIGRAAADLRAGQRRNARLQFAQERDALGDHRAVARLTRRISRHGLLRIVHQRRQHLVRVETRVNRRKPPRAADKQTRPGQQDERQGDLRDDQAATQPRTRRLSARGARAFFQRLAQMRFGHFRMLPRGRKAEDQSRQQRHQRCETERPAVYADMFGARQIGRREFDQRLYSPRRQQYAQRSAEDRQQQAFGQQLPRQPEASRAQCRAHGEFLAPRLATRERQIGHVGAGDEQDEADRAQQQPERSANIAHHFIQQRRDEDSHLVVLDRILAPQRGGDLIELRLRLFDGNALFQTPHHHQEVVATLSLIFRQARRRPDFVSGGKLKLRRRNPDDRMRFSVELDGFSDDRFLAAKAATPQTVADDGDARRPGRVIRREKKTPAFRFYAEELKEIGRDVTTYQ